MLSWRIYFTRIACIPCIIKWTSFQIFLKILLIIIIIIIIIIIKWTWAALLKIANWMPPTPPPSSLKWERLKISVKICWKRSNNFDFKRGRIMKRLWRKDGKWCPILLQNYFWTKSCKICSAQNKIFSE